MIIHDVEQGTDNWLYLRAGIPTSSEFSKILTPKTMKLSSQADNYANRLVAELLLQRPVMKQGTEWMERGSVLEVEAIREYEFETDSHVKRAGFITDDRKMYGTSPDGIVGDDGLLEIKCLEESAHMGFLLSGEVKPEHMPQIQGQLFITGRKWVDWFAYHHSELPSVRIRVERDSEYIEKLSGALEIFWNILLNKIEKLREKGFLEEDIIESAGKAIMV